MCELEPLHRALYYRIARHRSKPRQTKLHNFIFLFMCSPSPPNPFRHRIAVNDGQLFASRASYDSFAPVFRRRSTSAEAVA